MIGAYARPRTRLPGGGGAPEIATHAGRIYIVMRHSPRAFVRDLDFVTSLGHGLTGRERRQMGLRTEGPTLIVTDLCTMMPDLDTKEFEVVSVHPGVSRDAIRENTGWNVRFRETVHETPAPAAYELEALRDLNARTARAHGTSAGE